MIKERVSDIIAAMYIFLFVYAGVSKLLDIELFRVQISQSPLLTDVAALLSWAVPGLEVVIAICLVFNKTRLAGFYAALMLMVAFTGYIVLASRFSDFVPCSCGGVIQQMSWSEHLLFNLFFIVTAVVGILLTKSEYNFMNRLLK